MIFTNHWKVLVLNFSGMGNKVFFSVKKLMERWYLHGIIELSMIFQDLGNMVFHAVIVSIKRQRTNENRTVCSCHTTYAFQSKSSLYSCLNVKELLAQSRREIWRISDCNWTRTQNHLCLKRTLNHSTIVLKRTLKELSTKWLCSFKN